MGAIESGKTICGFLFGGAIFLGYLAGVNTTAAPEVQDEKRTQAIESVRELFKGFMDRFGDTDCRALTGCDFSKKEEADRYIREEVYKDTCFHQFEYALSHCLSQKGSDSDT